jgi:hypothetical protein
MSCDHQKVVVCRGNGLPVSQRDLDPLDTVVIGALAEKRHPSRLSSAILYRIVQALVRLAEAHLVPLSWRVPGCHAEIKCPRRTVSKLGASQRQEACSRARGRAGSGSSIERLPSPLVRFLAWLKRYLRRLSFGGESQIAMESQGEEVIDQEEWTKLAESERDKWEPADESPWLYRRKRERW